MISWIALFQLQIGSVIIIAKMSVLPDNFMGEKIDYSESVQLFVARTLSNNSNKQQFEKQELQLKQQEFSF